MPKFLSTTDNASAVQTVPTIQGELTITGSTTTTLTVSDTMTNGAGVVYILNADHVSDYSAGLPGTWAANVFTYTTPLGVGKEATAASDEGKWLDATYVGTEKLPEIIVDANTTITSLESFDVITTGDSLLVYNATDGMVERTAGTVTTTGVLDPDGANNISTTDSVPTMTGFTTPSGVAFSTLEEFPTISSWEAFDDNPANTVGWEVTATNLPRTIGYAPSTGAFICNKFTITSEDNGSGVARSPSSFDFVCTNSVVTNTATANSATWTTIASYTGQTFTQNQTKTFTATNETAYLAYGIRVNTNNGDTYLGIKEVEFIELVNTVKYQAPLEDGLGGSLPTSIPATKAFFNNPTTYSLAVEDTANRCISKDEVLDFVSSYFDTYVGTNAISGLIKTGDTLQLDGATEVVTSSVVESVSSGNLQPDGSLNASTTDNLPTFTSDTSGAYSLSSSSVSVNNWNAVDDVLSNDSWRPSGALPQWFQVNTPAVIYNKYSLYCNTTFGDNNTKMPNTWTIRGSTDNFATVDDVLATETGITWALGETKYFTFTNSTAYTSYRINITANNGHPATDIYELEFIEAVNNLSLPQYTATFDAQATAPTSAKVLDRSVPLTTTRTYNSGNNNFDVTMDSPLGPISGRAAKLKIEMSKTGTEIDIDTAQINLHKEP